MGFAISRTNTRVSLVVYGTRPKTIFGFRRWACVLSGSNLFHLLKCSSWTNAHHNVDFPTASILRSWNKKTDRSLQVNSLERQKLIIYLIFLVLKATYSVGVIDEPLSIISKGRARRMILGQITDLKDWYQRGGNKRQTYFKIIHFKCLGPDEGRKNSPSPSLRISVRCKNGVRSFWGQALYIDC